MACAASLAARVEFGNSTTRDAYPSVCSTSCTFCALELNSCAMFSSLSLLNGGYPCQPMVERAQEVRPFLLAHVEIPLGAITHGSSEWPLLLGSLPVPSTLPCLRGW